MLIINMSNLLSTVNFLAIPNYLLDNRTLSLRDSLVYATISNWARILKTSMVDISINELAGELNCSTRTISRSINKLIKCHLLGRRLNGKGNCATYYFPIPSGVELKPENTLVLDDRSKPYTRLQPKTGTSIIANPEISVNIAHINKPTDILTSLNEQPSIAEINTTSIIIIPANKTIEPENKSSDNFPLLAHDSINIATQKTPPERQIYHKVSLDQLEDLRKKLPIAPTLNCPNCLGIGFIYVDVSDQWHGNDMISCECTDNPIVTTLALTNTKIGTSHSSTESSYIDSETKKRTANLAVNASSADTTQITKSIPKSKHSQEICLKFAYAEAKDKQRIQNPPGFGKSIYMSGKQDQQIDSWLKLQAQLYVGGNAYPLGQRHI